MSLVRSQVGERNRDKGLLLLLYFNKLRSRVGLFLLFLTLSKRLQYLLGNIEENPVSLLFLPTVFCYGGKEIFVSQIWFTVIVNLCFLDRSVKLLL